MNQIVAISVQFEPAGGRLWNSLATKAFHTTLARTSAGNSILIVVASVRRQAAAGGARRLWNILVTKCSQHAFSTKRKIILFANGIGERTVWNTMTTIVFHYVTSPPPPNENTDHAEKHNVQQLRASQPVCQYQYICVYTYTDTYPCICIYIHIHINVR